jgi:hypothetical protein
MAAIASIDASTPVGHFAAALTTLTASDTITIRTNKKQLLVLRNPTGGTLTLNIDGDGASAAYPVPGAAVIDLTGGYSIAVGTLVSRAIMLGTISGYTKGVVTLTGASGMIAQLFDI